MRSPRPVRMAVACIALAAPLAAPAASAGDIVLRRDGSKAVYAPPAAPHEAGSDQARGFQLDDAGIGAAAMLALVAGATGVITLRGRRHSARPMRAN
jgi:hypothetical protein